MAEISYVHIVVRRARRLFWRTLCVAPTETKRQQDLKCEYGS